MSVSFSGFNENTATFKVSSAITAGKPVKISANNTVAACSDADAFCGFVVSSDSKYASVQLGGVVTAPYTGTAPTVGYGILVSDGTGVKSAETGKEYLILSVDSTAATVTFLM